MALTKEDLRRLQDEVDTCSELAQRFSGLRTPLRTPMFSVQNYTGDPSTWTLCGCCGSSLPVVTVNGTRRVSGAWVQVAARIISIVCLKCEEKALASQPAPKGKKAK
jgi:hypothetical protein